MAYSNTSLTFANCSLDAGGYAQVGNLVIANLRIKVTSAGASIDGLPKPYLATSKLFVGGSAYDTANERSVNFYINSNGRLLTPSSSGTGTFILTAVYISR